MRVVAFVVAALCSVAVIGIRFFGGDGRLAVAALVIAALSLALGFYEQAKHTAARPVKLNADQEQTVRTMLAQGNRAGAVGQVRLWFRHASVEQARRVVDAL